ncbi:hypothetical protein C2S51_007807 [Perilla frutescens var. frutescens]|nr:hypothetical protein C2S51_007807 [Perilla frutescens var. frutescens]
MSRRPAEVASSYQVQPTVLHFPVGQGKIGVTHETPEDPLVEIQVPAVEEEEEPGVVNGDFGVGVQRGLRVATLAVSAVDLGLLSEAAWVVGVAFVEVPHHLYGLPVLGYAVLVELVRRLSQAHARHLREHVWCHGLGDGRQPCTYINGWSSVITSEGTQMLKSGGGMGSTRDLELRLAALYKPPNPISKFLRSIPPPPSHDTTNRRGRRLTIMHCDN